jgi:hypothetical protein
MLGARINYPDLAFAGFLIALGAIALTLAWELPVGSATSMGPGYVPRGLALLIVLAGALMAARALFAGYAAFPAVAMRPLLLVCAAVALFALLLRVAGLALASVAVVLCAGYAAYDARWRENALLAIGLAVFAVALFVYALGLPLPVWPPR